MNCCLEFVRDKSPRYPQFMEDDRVLGIFKFQTRQRIEQFVQGLLYMNTLEYFVKDEGGEGGLARNDPHEGMSHMVQGRGAILQMKTGGEFKAVGSIPVRCAPGNQTA